jgi:hypothetical protein
MKIQQLTRPRCLMEVEPNAGGFPPSELDDMQDPDFDNRQGDLFGDKIPTLEPHVPKGYERVGRIGPYVMLYKTTSYGDDQLYVLLDKFKVIGWVCLHPLDSKNMDYPGMLRAMERSLNGNGLQINGVQVNRDYAGQSRR